MKRLIALFLTISLSITLFACGKAENPAENTPVTTGTPTVTAQTVDFFTDDMEIQRAMSYGFVPEEIQGDWDKAVTYEQFCKMLGNMLVLTDDLLLDKWEALNKDLPDEMITRQEAMLACFLAGQLMSLTEADNYRLEQTVEQNFNVNMNSMFYPAWDQTAYTSSDGLGQWENYIIAGVFYGMRQTSRVSALPLFAPDGNDLRIKDALTRKEAILAAVRLYESDRTVSTVAVQVYLEQLKDVPELKSILSAADERREEILNSKTAIEMNDTFTPGKTYSGTAFYVSNNGDDNADGLTPETAWATIDKVNNANLRPGDAVFFERGGVWHGVRVYSKESVTYSAYGEGEKPKLYGSTENGAGSEKWKLYAETQDGGKIWVYYKDMLDCSALVFNGGDAWTNRNVPFWNGKDFVASLEDETPIDVTTWLSEDLTTFSAASSELPSSLPAYADWHSSDTTFDMLSNSGPLYLRCDAGNPGEVYNAIEFLVPNCPFDGAAINSVIDNLSIMYSSYGGIMCGQNDGVTVQNCEIGWTGGRIASYLYEATTQNENGYTTNMAGIQTNGGAITTNGSHCKYINNYVHHSYQEGLSLESGIHHGESGMIGTVYSGNLAEFCSQGVILCNWDIEPDPNHCFTDCAFTDNYVLYSGYETFGYERYIVHDAAAFTSQGGPNMYTGTMEVSDNVFCLASGRLIQIDNFDEQYSRIYSNNTYAQLTSGIWLNTEHLKAYCGNSDTAAEAVNTVLGDTMGTVISIGE